MTISNLRQLSTFTVLALVSSGSAIEMLSELPLALLAIWRLS